MKVNVVESGKEQMKVEIDDIGFANLMNENVWKKKVDFAACTRQHPYLSKPTLIVKAKDPKRAIIDAAEQVIEDVKELRKQLKRE